MPAQNASFIGSIPENYDRFLGPALFAPYAADLVTRLQVPEGGSVLELACGTGIVTRRLRNSLSSNVKLVATDLNQAMIDFAMNKFSSVDEVEFKQADATELPFADKLFDAVVCQFGLMFIPDKARAVREAHRVLKPGGSFIFNVWDTIEQNDLAQIAHTTIASFFERDPPDFYQVPFSLHDPDEIRTLLMQAGFRDIDLSILQLSSESTSAADVAKGLVEGNPVIIAINERCPGKVAQIESAVAIAVAARCGEAPVRGKMKAWVCTAVA